MRTSTLVSIVAVLALAGIAAVVLSHRSGGPTSTVRDPDERRSGLGSLAHELAGLGDAFAANVRAFRSAT